MASNSHIRFIFIHSCLLLVTDYFPSTEITIEFHIRSESPSSFLPSDVRVYHFDADVRFSFLPA